MTYDSFLYFEFVKEAAAVGSLHIYCSPFQLPYLPSSLTIFNIMLSKLSRTAKVAIALGAATLVILATTLGVTLSPSRRDSNTSSSSLSDNTSGQGSEETPASVPCPCFDGSDLDTAVDTIVSDADIVFQSEQTCVEGDFNGIRYSKYDHALGYGVALGNTNECEDADARMIISQEEAESCSLLLDAKCEEHAGALEAAASTGNNEEPATCRCFDSNSLLSVVESVIDNSQILHSGSCDSNSTNMYISYSIQAGDYPEAYAWGASTYNGELTCTHHDALQSLKLQDEWDACKAIVDSACAQIADAQDAE